MIPEEKFLSLFATGNHSYKNDDVQVFYTDENGKHWFTTGGDQTGSIFEIVDAVSTGNAFDPKCRALVKFSCKVYNSDNPMQSKSITDATLVAEFLGMK